MATSILSRDQQIQVIGALTEGVSIRSIERMTGIHRDTIRSAPSRPATTVAAAAQT
jgi:hypothetical protein